MSQVQTGEPSLPDPEQPVTHLHSRSLLLQVRRILVLNSAAAYHQVAQDQAGRPRCPNGCNRLGGRFGLDTFFQNLYEYPGLKKTIHIFKSAKTKYFLEFFLTMTQKLQNALQFIAQSF